MLQSCLITRQFTIFAVVPLTLRLATFSQRYPSRCFNVGIAEQHGVTFEAGLAAGGLRPFCAMYSTFLQRGYDQVVHDVALQDLPVRFAIDRPLASSSSAVLAFIGCSSQYDQIPSFPATPAFSGSPSHYDQRPPASSSSDAPAFIYRLSSAIIMSIGFGQHLYYHHHSMLRLILHHNILAYSP